MRVRGSLFGLAVIAATLLGADARAEPLKIRIGWAVVPAQLEPILFEHAGLAKHLGTSYTVEAIRMAGSSPMLTALASGDLDIAPLAYSSFGPALQNAGMTDLRIIADEFRDGVEGYYSTEYMVSADSPIKAVEDLKGKVLATNAIGGAQDMAARAMLRKHGLEFGRDFTDVEVAFPNMKAVLAEKKADLIVGVKPFTEDPSLRSIARTLFTQRDAVGTTEMIVWTARQGYLQKHRAALVDFMEDVVRSYHWYLDPANHDEVIAIVARFTKQPPERLTGWVFTRNDYYRTPDAMPDLDALQKNIDMQRELGFLKDGIDIKRYADLGILMEAAKRVHP